MKDGYYWRRAAEFKARLAAAIPHDELKELHRRVWWKHALVLLRQVALGVAAGWLAVETENPLLWLPLSVFLGFTAFNFTVLLHEVVHSTLFAGLHPRLEALMGYLYALPSGISRSQFTRWHLDHHNELGSPEGDPKRHWLTPKVVKRWYKLLYCTPVLFPIYFRAAAREAASYPASLRRRIQRERQATIALHLAAMAAAIGLGSWMTFLKLYALPYFVVFPVAFTLNRLGQHYNIDPTNPVKWGTRMQRSRIWDFLFCWSNYHLEHHYFPGVPLYNLRRLNRALEPFYRAEGVPERSYREILWGWFVLNRPPHTNWDAGTAPLGGTGAQQAPAARAAQAG